MIVEEYPLDTFETPMQNDYYCRNGIRVIDVIDNWELNFSKGCIVKYVLRAGFKPGTEELQDLEKALDYIKHEIERVKLVNKDQVSEYDV